MNTIPNNQNAIDTHPILILDLDGVVFSPEYIQTPRKSAIEQLNRIIRETNCKIVVSSSHKIVYKHNIELMNNKFNEWGIIGGEIIGFTYGMMNEDGTNNGREREILYWVNKHNPKNYCAIDDSIREDNRFVRTIHVLGILECDANRVISWLNNGTVDNFDIHINSTEFNEIIHHYGENYASYMDVDKIYLNDVLLNKINQ